MTQSLQSLHVKRARESRRRSVAFAVQQLMRQAKTLRLALLLFALFSTCATNLQAMSRDSIWIFTSGIDNQFFEQHRPLDYMFSTNGDTLYTLTASELNGGSDTFTGQEFEVQCWDSKGKLLSHFIGYNNVRRNWPAHILLTQIRGRAFVVFRPNPNAIKIVSLPDNTVIDSLAVPYQFPIQLTDDSVHLGWNIVSYYDLQKMQVGDTTQLHFWRSYSVNGPTYYNDSMRVYRSKDASGEDYFVRFDARNTLVVDTEKVDVHRYFRASSQGLFGYSTSLSATSVDTIWQFLPLSFTSDSIVLPCAIKTLKVFDTTPSYIVMSPQRRLYSINYQTKEVRYVGTAISDSFQLDNEYSTLCYRSASAFVIYSIPQRKIVRQIAPPSSHEIFDFHWISNGLLFAFDTNNLCFVATPRDSMLRVLENYNTYQLSNRKYNAVLTRDSSSYYIIHNQSAFFRYSTATNEFEACTPYGGIDFIVETTKLLDSNHLYVGGWGMVGSHRDRVIDVESGMVSNLFERSLWWSSFILHDVVFSNDSLILVSIKPGFEDQRTGLYNRRTKTMVRSCKDNGMLYDVSSDSRILITSADSNRIRFIDLIDSSQSMEVAINFKVKSAVLTPDLKSIVFQTADGQIGLVTIATGRFKWIQFTSSNEERLLGFSPNDSLICTTENFYNPATGIGTNAVWPDYTTPFKYLRWTNGDSVVTGSTGYARVSFNVYTNQRWSQVLDADYYCIPESDAYVESYTEKNTTFNVRTQSDDSLISSAMLRPIPNNKYAIPQATFSTLSNPLMLAYLDSARSVVVWRLATSKKLDVGVFDLGLQSASYHAYPTPACNQLQLRDADKWRSSQMSVYTLHGMLVKTLKLASNTVDISDLGNGVYGVLLQNGKEHALFTIIVNCR